MNKYWGKLINWIKSRANVAILMLSIVIALGGVGGAFAISSASQRTSVQVSTDKSTNPMPTESNTKTQTNRDSNKPETDQETSPKKQQSDTNKSDASPSSNNGVQSNTSCPYTSAQLAYYDSQRASIQAQIDQKNGAVDQFVQLGRNDPHKYSSLAGAQAMLTQWQNWLVALPNAQTDMPASYDNVVNNLIPYWQGLVDVYSDPNSIVSPEIQGRIDGLVHEVEVLIGQRDLIPSC